MVEDIVGCKWQQSVRGLTTKVLNERLRKLVRFGILDRQSFAEVPPRVEYRLTPFGEKFSGVLDAIRELERHVT
jgi:DNA-binding HxlR family transcriptional regulator